MPIETYPQALAFWYSRINYEQRGMPADLRELKLDRMRSLLTALGRPEDRLRIVHVAGSKGKGSTSAMLACILREAGYRTGLFTSPHLTHVEERCQVGGEPITPGELTALMREIETASCEVEKQHVPPTFFEVATALGFLHFVRRRVDVAVVEVGLGGRFDSTNVCTPLVSVITSISLDHVEQLGHTLAAIAGEKAGILKHGRPAVSGATDGDARRVIAEMADQNGAPLDELGREFGFEYTPGQVTHETDVPARVTVRVHDHVWKDLELGLLGRHQGANAAVALAVVERLRQRGLTLPEKAVRAGLRQVQWPARLEVCGRRPLILLDCAHNVASMEALVETLAASFPVVERTLVFACSRDKDLPGMLAVLAPHFARAIFTRYTSSPRSAVPEELAQLWRAAGGRAEATAPSPAAALEVARAAAGPADLICITGSVFLAGEARPLLRK